MAPPNAPARAIGTVQIPDLSSSTSGPSANDILAGRSHGINGWTGGRMGSSKDGGENGARHPHLRRPNPKHPERVDDAILGLLAKAFLEEGATSVFIRREGVAAHLNVPEHTVSQSLERLNKRGLVGPEVNRPAHDSNRDTYGDLSGWSGSIRHAQAVALEALFNASDIQGLTPPPPSEHARSRGTRP